MWEAFALQKLLSFFSTKNIGVFGYKVVKRLTSWPLNGLIKLLMLWTTGPRCTGWSVSSLVGDLGRQVFLWCGISQSGVFLSLQEHVEFGVNLDVTTYKNGKRETHNPVGRAYAPVVWDFYQVGCSADNEFKKYLPLISLELLLTHCCWETLKGAHRQTVMWHLIRVSTLC